MYIVVIINAKVGSDLSSLTHSEDILLNNRQKREWGEKTYPIWLLFNPKHPAVRHHIWTPILSVIQDNVFRKLRTRIDTSNIYIRYAVSDSGIVPNTQNWWDTKVDREINEFRELADEYEPRLLISFGAFPYEFVRRVYTIKPEKGPKYWGTTNLGDEFTKSIDNFDINRTNRIPLLRRIVASGKFVEDPFYSENYFEYAGTKISERIIENKERLDIWME